MSHEMMNDEQALVELSEDQLAEVTGGHGHGNWGGNSYSYNSNRQFQYASGGILSGNNVSIDLFGYGNETYQSGGNNFYQSQKN